VTEEYASLVSCHTCIMSFLSNAYFMVTFISPQSGSTSQNTIEYNTTDKQ